MLKTVLVAAGVACGFALPAAAQGPAFPSPPLSAGAGAMRMAPMHSAASGPVTPAQVESAPSAADAGTEASVRVPVASIDTVVRDSLGKEVGRIVRASEGERQVGLVTLAAADGRTKTISAANLKLRSGTLFSDMSAASLWGQ
jgi:hypothetical protein